VTEEVI